MRSAGKRRRQAKRRNGSPSDDADYEPGLKVQRPRKAVSGSAMKIKSPGRTRLTLAGTASVVGNLFTIFPLYCPFMLLAWPHSPHACRYSLNWPHNLHEPLLSLPPLTWMCQPFV